MSLEYAQCFKARAKGFGCGQESARVNWVEVVHVGGAKQGGGGCVALESGPGNLSGKDCPEGLCGESVGAWVIVSVSMSPPCHFLL